MITGVKNSVWPKIINTGQPRESLQEHNSLC